MSSAKGVETCNAAPSITESSKLVSSSRETYGSVKATDGQPDDHVCGNTCHMHDPLLGWTTTEQCRCAGMVCGDEEDSDSENAAASMLLPLTPSFAPFFEGSRSDSDSSLSSFTNLCSSCTDVIEELKPEEVRWFYKYDNDKKWTPFLGYDSLRLEARYRECKKLNELKEAVDRVQMDLSASPPLDIMDDPKIEKIHVRGGLYETDVNSRKCSSIYWAGDQFSIMRGTWFHDGTWQPLDEWSEEQIELAHMKKFRGQRCSDFIQVTPSKGPKPVIHNLQLPNFHVDWNSPREVFLFSEATSSKLMRSFTQRFGFQK